MDTSALVSDLRERVRGEVRFDNGSRALYATDSSNYRQVPIGVVIPLDIDDVVQTVATARQHGVPILSRGGGTSLAGQCCNVALVMDFSKYVNNIVDIDTSRRRARVQPGIVLDKLRGATERLGLTFGPDPATHTHCTLGGMIGNNSCGVHSVMSQFYGPGPRTSDNVVELDVLTYDGLRMRVGPTPDEELERIIHEGGRRGAIYGSLRDLRDRYADLIRARYPKIPRRVSGYNLDELLPERGFNVARALVATESTCVTILEATVELIHNPKARSLLVLGYPTVYDAADHIPEVMAAKPIGCEGIDDLLVEYMIRKGLHPQNRRLLPEGGGWLLVEFGGDSKEDSDAHARGLMDALKGKKDAPSMKLYDDPDDEHTLWVVRESGLGATAFVPGMPDMWDGWEDSAVPPGKLGAYLRDFRPLLDKYGYQASLYGHFGQGCLHCRISFDLVTAEGIRTWRAFLDEAADTVLKYGGALSGEHGDGQSRAELLPKMYGPELVRAFGEFKAIWDPLGRMNPGKIVDPYPITSNLRLGTSYRPAQPATYFKFPDDHGSFSRATLRCVGVGECRRDEGGTMCPSYRVTREEKHATRGRAHLLFEMLRGEVIQDGWKSEEVKEALDLCLACKGCKGDCPVNVDVATYKAEFLAHYYEGRVRPRHAYAFGFINRWAQLASMAPWAVNFATHTPPLASLAKLIAGMAPQREVPRFAPETFKHWFERQDNGGPPSGGKSAEDLRQGSAGHPPRARTGRQGGPGARDVILWADTFNNHFFPSTLSAAVEVLRDAGFRPKVPRASLCCGRPLYDYGLLGQARDQLLDILDALRPEIRAGVPVVGMEPSCVAVFRDELTSLFPHDEDARRLARQTFTLSELLRHAGYTPPRLERHAILHVHCHHKSVMKMDDELAMLRGMGLDIEMPESGCCGMAGSFGFEEDKYDVAMAIGERALLPAVRKASDDTLIIADGFSCREQIAQGTGRRALHPVEVLQLAIRRQSMEGVRPEEAVAAMAPADLGHRPPVLPAAAAVAGIAAAAAVAMFYFTRPKRSAAHADRRTA